MAAYMDDGSKLNFILKDLVTTLFEDSPANIKPSSYEVFQDYKTLSYELVMVFSEGFSINIRVPNHQLLDKSILNRFSTLASTLEGASVHFTQTMYNNLYLGNGHHLVAVVGGYSHGETILIDISHPSIVVAAVEPFNQFAKEDDLVCPPTFTTVTYELSKYVGGGVPGYILRPKGERPSIEFINMAFKEFPLLSLLPASQGFVQTNTAFLSQHTSLFPLRNEFR